MEIREDSILRMGCFIKSPPAVVGMKGRVKGWYRRWFVLCIIHEGSLRSVMLYYFENQKAFQKRKDPKGKIDLETCTEIKRHQACTKHDNYDHSIVLEVKKEKNIRTFHLCNDDYKEREDWYQDIKKEMDNLKWGKKNKSEDDQDDMLTCDSPSYLPEEQNRIEIEIANQQRKRGPSLYEDSGSKEDDSFNRPISGCEEDHKFDNISVGSDENQKPCVRVSALSGYASDIPDKYSQKETENLTQNDEEDELSTSFTGPKLFNSNSRGFIKAKSMSNLSCLSSLNDLYPNNQQTIYGQNSRSSRDQQTNDRSCSDPGGTSNVSQFRGARRKSMYEGFIKDIQLRSSDKSFSLPKLRKDLEISSKEIQKQDTEVKGDTEDKVKEAFYGRFAVPEKGKIQRTESMCTAINRYSYSHMISAQRRLSEDKGITNTWNI